MNSMTQIEITFLGTTAGIPTHNRNHASIYLRYYGREEEVVLFDCGEGTQKQIFSAHLNFMRIDNIFISHWHADHFAGLLGLLFTMNMEDRRKPLTIYGPEAEEWVDNIINLGYGKLRFPVHVKNVPYEGSDIVTLLDTDEITVKSIPVRHGVPAVAYALFEKDRVKIDKDRAKEMGLPDKGRIFQVLKDTGEIEWKGRKIKLSDISIVEKGKSIVYTGDTLPCDNIIKISQNADVLIHDATFFEEDREGEWKHAVLEDALNAAKEASVKQLILTHISRRYQNLEEIEKTIKDMPNVRLARDFLKVTI